MKKDTVLKQIVGAKIKTVEGLAINSDSVKIETDKGKLTLYHDRVCCESVYIEEITGGDSSDLIGSTVSEFRESSDSSDDGTWTFYHIVTSNVDITIRWLGYSDNGQYSESVDIVWNDI